MRRILIIQTAFIGDVILATPLVEKLARFYPTSEIDFLVRQGNESLLKDHPKINEVLVWDKRKRKYNDMMRVAKRIRSREYDLLINLQRFASSGFLTSYSRAKRKIGFSKNPFSFLFSKKFPHRIGNGVHEVSRNLLLIQEMTDDSFQRPVLYPSRQDQKRVAQFQEDQYYCIAPTSVLFTKQWPAHKWIALIDNLPRNRVVYLMGAKSDKKACAEIVKETDHPAVHSLAGELSLLQSAALMGGAVRNYVNDSAPLHLCSAMNAPVTAIFCNTIPEFGFGPLSDDSKIVEVEEELTCRPCGITGKKSCPKGHFKCAEDIKIDQVL